MIIKNPYNIVARHYRLINILILVPMIYLLLKFQDIAVFFREFVRNGYSTIETNFADTYVTSLTFGVLVFMLIFNGFFYIMFVSKKKNGLFYAISAIVYIALIILALLFHGSMSGIKNIDATFANFVRDMANISVLPQYALIIATIVKASGFNIKTLRFEKRAALSVDEDDEEIEIKIGSDKNTTKRNVVHLIRELKYYILENKLVFSILGGAAGIAIIIGLYINFRVNHRVYTFNQEVSSDTFDIALKDSYITDVDYRGNVIAEGKYYLVIKLGLYNKFGDTTIDKSVFRIEFDKTSMFPTYDRSSRFVDIGKPYEGQMVKYQQQDDYVFVYELKPNEVKGTYKLKILNKSTVTNEGLKTSYKVINVKPKNITKEKDLGSIKVGKEVKLRDTTLGETTFKINKYQIVEYYSYEQEECDNNNYCTTYKHNIVPSVGKALMIIDDEINYDEKSSYYKNSYKDFYGDFVSLAVKPKPAGEGLTTNMYISPMKNVTPKNMTGKKVYEVSIDTLNAEKIEMIVKIRNNKFTIKLLG